MAPCSLCATTACSGGHNVCGLTVSAVYTVMPCLPQGRCAPMRSKAALGMPPFAHRQARQVQWRTCSHLQGRKRVRMFAGCHSRGGSNGSGGADAPEQHAPAAREPPLVLRRCGAGRVRGAADQGAAPENAAHGARNQPGNGRVSRGHAARARARGGYERRARRAPRARVRAGQHGRGCLPGAPADALRWAPRRRCRGMLPLLPAFSQGASGTLSPRHTASAAQACPRS